VRRADMVREWIARDELADEMFDMLDAIGKGVSFTEIVWDTSEGQWYPQRLEWRDPRWFTFDQTTMKQPMLRGGVDGGAVAEPLPAFKFIYAQIKAKSGLPIRSGIARLAAWSWMFKAFTQRDWAIFAQTYGQPVRIGKFHEGATKEDRATLYRAVANIAGDCAAIIPRRWRWSSSRPRTSVPAPISMSGARTGSTGRFRKRSWGRPPRPTRCLAATRSARSIARCRRTSRPPTANRFRPRSTET
jgi:phage gp29-like protein